MSLTSVIVPCWNGAADTRRCLAALARWTPEPHETIVVDNGSTDGTAAVLRDFPNVRVLRNRTNKGFAAAINRGAAAARGGSVVWLNNDAVVTPGWLSGLLACARPARVGAAGPCTNEIAGGGVQQAAGARYGGARGAARFAAAWALGPGPGSKAVPKLAGFCLLVKAEAMRKAGPLDERFRLGGYEDLDYCLRLRDAGYELRLARRVFVHHAGHRSFRANGVGPEAPRRNLERFVEKWTTAGLDRLGYRP